MKSIRTKILLIVVAIVFATSAIQTFISVTRTYKSMQSSVSQTLQIISSKAEQQISDLNQSHFNLLHAIASLPYYKSTEITLEEKCGQLVNMVQADPATYINVAFYDAEGYTIYGDGSKVYFGDMDYVKAALKGNDVVSDPLIWAASDMEGRYDGDNEGDAESFGTQVLIFYAVPVYNENNRIIGTIVAIVNGLRFSDIVKEIDIGNGFHPAIIARSTAEIFGSAKPEIESEIDIKKMYESGLLDSYKNSILKGEQGTGDIESLSEPVIFGYNPIPNTNWSLLIAVPYMFYFGALRSVILFSTTGFIISIIVTIILITIVVAAIVKPLKTVSTAINEIASGNADLTKNIEIKSKDEVGSVVMGFNNFTEKLHGILLNIKKSQENLEVVGKAMDSSTQDTGNSIADIIENIKDIHSQITTQTASVQQTAGAVNEIASNIASLENLINYQSTGVESASSAVEEMMGNIESVNRSVDKMAESFDRLIADTQNGSSKQEDVSNKVEQIVAQSEMLQEANQVISSIAEQTNLLAMNAAIEAAHAGDAGKGFSVVADEIRKLSETSTSQSKTIGDQLNSIKESISQVVLASEESNKAFISVTTAIKQTDEIVRMIKAAMEEQTIGSKQINEALHEMNDSTSKVRTASHEMSEGNKQILDEVQNLQNITLTMKESMEEMSGGAERINATGTELNEISQKMKNAIQQISDEVKLFKV